MNDASHSKEDTATHYPEETPAPHEPSDHNDSHRMTQARIKDLIDKGELVVSAEFRRLYRPDNNQPRR